LIRQPLNESTIAGAAILSGETVNIADCQRDGRWSSQEGGQSGVPPPRQLLCVPVLSMEGSKAIGAIQVINSHHGMSFTEKDRRLILAFSPYLQVAINNQNNKGAVELAVQQVAASIMLSTIIASTHTTQGLLNEFFEHVCCEAKCDYMALYVPPPRLGLGEAVPRARRGSLMASSDGPVYQSHLVTRYDNHSEHPKKLSLTEGTVVHAAMTSNRFANVRLGTPPGPLKRHARLKLIDVLHGPRGRRGWMEVIAGEQTECEQALAADVQCVEGVDFEKQNFEAGKWLNMLLIPIVSSRGTYVLQLAGKTQAQCFSIADEELLVLAGTPFISATQSWFLREEKSTSTEGAWDDETGEALD